MHKGDKRTGFSCPHLHHLLHSFQDETIQEMAN